jgi:acyl dehydratase
MNANTYDALEVGQTFTVDRHITAEDVQKFADVTGDDNPLHIDEAFAAGTRFGKPSAHGVLLLGIISKVLGRDFPGPGSIAVSISSKFLRPVPVDSTITVEVRVAEKLEKYRHIKMKVYVYMGKKMSVAGEATLIPPPAPEEG